MDKDAYYFPHFSNARHDRKLRRVRKELGIEGYGIYFMVLEVLRDQDDFSYPMEDVDLLADEFGTSEQKVRVVICNYGLFLVTDDEFFYSPKLIEYLSPYLEQKKRNRVNGIKGNLIKYGYASKSELEGMTPDEILSLNADKGILSGGDRNPDPIGDRKESKVKQSKEKEIKEESVSTNVHDVPNASDDITWQSAIRVANRLLESIQQWDSTHKYNSNPPSLESWVKDIDKAIRLDGRTEEQLNWIIDFLFTKNHRISNFWSSNIQSGKKLREKFDTIKNQIKSEKHGTKKPIEQSIAETEDFLSRYSG